jgi:hypothetical protein
MYFYKIEAIKTLIIADDFEAPMAVQTSMQRIGFYCDERPA